MNGTALRPIGQASGTRSAPWLWMAAAFAVGLALAAAVLAVLGTDARSIRVALRVTARWSFLLFWLAYVAGPMAALFGPALAPAARRGRELGLAFASAHLVHIGLVVWLYWITDRAPLSGGLLVFFTIGVGWIYLLAALSFGLSDALAPRAWRTLRFLGMNYILFAFAYDFVPAGLHLAVVPGPLWRRIDYVPFAAMTAVAAFLRFAASVHRRAATPHAPA